LKIYNKTYFSRFGKYTDLIVMRDINPADK